MKNIYSLKYKYHVKILGDAFIASAGTLLTMFGYLMLVFLPADCLGPNGTWEMGWVMYLSAALQFNSIITVTIRYGQFQIYCFNYQTQSFKIPGEVRITIMYNLRFQPYNTSESHCTLIF